MSIKLQTSDGETVELEKDIAKKAILIKNILEDNDDEEEIPLPTVRKVTLEKVIEYCRHIHANEEPVVEKPIR